jgi:2-methylisocitrate lyase-like PEP mutase family enzyme
MATAQKDKAEQFRLLHRRPEAFVIANAWDTVSTRMLTVLQFEALATSSGAMAGTLGRRDGKVSREEAFVHWQRISSATDLPVAGDLENGYADAPDDVAATIRMAADAGLVGGSIEDATGDPERPIYDARTATERVAAAVRAARALPFHFTLTARAENFLRNRADLADTIARLRAYEEAGADVLFAPGLPDLEAVKAVCAALSKPVNFMVGIKGKSFTVATLQAAGVRRISLGGSLYRAAISGLYDAAREVREQGTFSYVERVAPARVLGPCFE